MKYVSITGKKIGIISIMMLVGLIFAFNPSVYGFGKPLKTDDIMPDIQLPVPVNESYQSYLGLTDAETFFLDEIKARYLIIQVYTMY